MAAVRRTGAAVTERLVREVAAARRSCCRTHPDWQRSSFPATQLSCSRWVWCIVDAQPNHCRRAWCLPPTQETRSHFSCLVRNDGAGVPSIASCPQTRQTESDFLDGYVYARAMASGPWSTRCSKEGPVSYLRSLLCMHAGMNHGGDYTLSTSGPIPSYTGRRPNTTRYTIGRGYSISFC